MSYKLHQTEFSQEAKEYMQVMIDKNLNYLESIGTNIEKVRFIFQPSYTYDFIRNIVNPEIKLLVPLTQDDKFDNTREVFNLSESQPKDKVRLNVESYVNNDPEQLVKDINNSKLGFVFFLVNEGDQYHYETNTPKIRYNNLDKEMEKYYGNNK